MIRIGKTAASALAGVALASAGCAQAQALINTGPAVFRTSVTSFRDLPFRTVVRQQFDYSCGSAALATLLRHHYGRDLDEAQVFRAMYAVGDQASIRRVGFSLLDMKTYLASAGLPADGYRKTLDQLAASRAPGIVVLTVRGYRHFAVLKGARDGRFLIGDPALGLHSYPAREFAKVWSGIVFEIHPRAAAGGFNLAADWNQVSRTPLRPFDNTSVAAFTRELPPIYQITPVLAPVP